MAFLSSHVNTFLHRRDIYNNIEMKENTMVKIFFLLYKHVYVMYIFCSYVNYKKKILIKILKSLL